MRKALLVLFSVSFLLLAISKVSYAGGLKVNSSQQAVELVKRKHSGKVLKVQSTNGGYRVKLLTKDGRVISYSVDAKTAKVN